MLVLIKIITNTLEISDPRLSLIARLGNIKTINGSNIPTKERTDAELTYIKDYAIDFYQCGGSQVEEEIKCTAEFLLQHPRYLSLIKGNICMITLSYFIIKVNYNLSI